MKCAWSPLWCNLANVQVFSAQHHQYCNYGPLIAHAVGARKSAITTQALQLSPWRMIGRESVLSTVRAQVLNIIHGKLSSLLLVTGDAGYGKTRFIQHLTNDEEFGGYKSRLCMFSGPGVRETSTIPFTPWRIILEVCCTMLVQNKLSTVTIAQTATIATFDVMLDIGVSSELLG